MFQTLKSNSPFSAPRDDTARASCGNGAKRKLLSFIGDKQRVMIAPRQFLEHLDIIP